MNDNRQTTFICNHRSKGENFLHNDQSNSEGRGRTVSRWPVNDVCQKALEDGIRKCPVTIVMNTTLSVHLSNDYVNLTRSLLATGESVLAQPLQYISLVASLELAWFVIDFASPLALSLTVVLYSPPIQSHNFFHQRSLVKKVRLFMVLLLLVLP
jgi:hypothetical protein